MKRILHLFKFFLISIAMLGAFSNNLQSQTTDELVIKYATAGNYYQLKQLLENGANANAKDENGYTALMSASSNDNLEICQLLINHGADVNAKNDYGWTVLIRAATDGELEVCKLLINYGADVNAKENYGRTALIYAAENGNLEICQLLIKYGADINAKNKMGYTAYDYATNDDIKELLSQTGGSSISTDELVIKYATEGNDYQLKQLLENGANPNAKDVYGWTAHLSILSHLIHPLYP
jgi:serine/threonine-protein phosphatase 6 regulatory ankyrin repeat subunit A/serine/threonine-protein phosphatase 6 regulatory ankyrin repeat subunit B